MVQFLNYLHAFRILLTILDIVAIVERVFSLKFVKLYLRSIILRDIWTTQYTY